MPTVYEALFLVQVLQADDPLCSKLLGIQTSNSDFDFVQNEMRNEQRDRDLLTSILTFIWSIDLKQKHCYHRVISNKQTKLDRVLHILQLTRLFYFKSVRVSSYEAMPFNAENGLAI